jgi:hypothetical protein
LPIVRKDFQPCGDAAAAICGITSRQKYRHIGLVSFLVENGEAAEGVREY